MDIDNVSGLLSALKLKLHVLEQNGNDCSMHEIKNRARAAFWMNETQRDGKHLR